MDVLSTEVADISTAEKPKARREEQDIALLVPDDDVAEPEVSIVVPALNEELTVGEFVEWCHEGFRRAGVTGEILIIDSSNDRTPEIALEKGARVLRTPKRGLGRAYIDSIPFIRGQYVIMGDADCTYDFREVRPFIEKLREGFDFVMGSRLKGYIEPGAMPTLHRYFGTPVTTWILNLVYSSKFSDIHCGMRAITKDALVRINLESQGWEYASEMILKAVRLGLRISEAPIRFCKDRNGRVSNVKRAGWLTPWRAGWDSLRVMFVYGADFFLFRPGLFFTVIGALAVALLSSGPVRLGSVSLTLHTHFLAGTLLLLGVTATYMGIIARCINDFIGAETERWISRFSYNRTAGISILTALLGFALDFWFLVVYVRQGYVLSPSDVRMSHVAVTGLLLILVGFLTFTFTLVLHALRRRALPRLSR